ncbi:CATION TRANSPORTING ATPASE [Salix purpurea]|uniref:CATION TRANSPORTING ATPASE n=1 Tax=Salix purpurea TaxID=77065 RepID=A0A9Q0SIG3_SALPP|nr:CATION TRANSPORTING ATPASE [Salix purpurea]
MENYLNENFGDVKGKNSSEEALQRWRNLCWLVKNRKRRFRFTANLSKRFEAEAIRRSNQEKLRVAVLVSKAALQFIHCLNLSSDYVVPKEVEEAGFQICADELGSIVEGHDVKKLKIHGEVEGIAEKLSTSINDGISTSEDLLNPWKDGQKVPTMDLELLRAFCLLCSSLPQVIISNLCSSKIWIGRKRRLQFRLPEML